jgi:hypothetical protein
MRPTVACSLMAQRHRCAFFSFGRRLHMTTSALFIPRTPDPDKTPRPQTHDQPSAPGSPILQDQVCVPVAAGLSVAVHGDYRKRRMGQRCLTLGGPNVIRVHTGYDSDRPLRSVDSRGFVCL